MYRKIEDFKSDWIDESQSTLKVFSYLTDESLNQKVSENGRSIGRLAWHIVLTIYEMLSKSGLDLKINMEEIDYAPVPESVKVISDEYEKASDEAIKAVTKSWSDESLLEDVNMYGENWKKGFILSSLIRHQTHHRAQITVLMRQAGLKVPGIYGPAYEEWESMNMKPME